MTAENLMTGAAGDVTPDVDADVTPKVDADVTAEDRTGTTASVAPDQTPPGATRVLFVGSSGGHLAQLLPLRTLVPQGSRTWVTFDTTDAVGALEQETDVVWAHHPTTRHLPNLLRNTVQAWRVMRSRRPDVVVTTGAAVAFPYFLLSRLFGAATMYIEVYDRVDSATLTARLCSPFADVLAVQWQEQRGLYREASVVGPLL